MAKRAVLKTARAYGYAVWVRVLPAPPKYGVILKWSRERPAKSLGPKGRIGSNPIHSAKRVGVPS